MIDQVLDRYADIILIRGLSLKDGDVLTINTEEINTEFALHIAKKAKRITGNGCYLQTIENGKIVSTEETETGHLIEKRPTAFLHIPTYRKMPHPELGKEYSAPELQNFRLLSDPLDTNIAPLVPFASAYLPSEAWGEALGEDLRFSYAIITEIFSLEEDDPVRILQEQAEVLEYEKTRLNQAKLVSCHLEDENGTDLSFSFLPSSRFTSDVERTKNGRAFVPTLFATSLFRAVDPKSAEGYFTVTRPFLLFGEEKRNMTVRLEGGKVRECIADPETVALFNLYLAQDGNAGFLSELQITEEPNPSSGIDLFGILEWDRMRTTTLCLGGPRARSLTDTSTANDSLVSLFLPVGSESLTVTAVTESGEERTVLSGGYLEEDD